MTDATAPTTRRALLGAALASTAAAAVSAMGPMAASAATGDPVLAGAVNDASSVTTLTSGGAVLHAASTDYSGAAVVDAYAMGYGTAVLAHAANGIGVVALAPHGVQGTSQTDGGTGTSGHAQGAGTTFGVRGLADSSGGTGVHGEAASGTGVHAVTTSGTALHATAPSGTALRVDGKVHLKRSGRTTIKAGTATKVVPLPGVTSRSQVYAMLAASRKGRYVRAVVPAAGYFKIVLNDKVASSTSVSWFVLD